MALINMITDQGNGKYIICEDTDPIYDKKICIIVKPKPTKDHKWNLKKKEWEQAIVSTQLVLVHKLIARLKEQKDLDFEQFITDLLSDFIILYKREPKSIEEFSLFYQENLEE